MVYLRNTFILVVLILVSTSYGLPEPSLKERALKCLFRLRMKPQVSNSFTPVIRNDFNQLLLKSLAVFDAVGAPSVDKLLGHLTEYSHTGTQTFSLHNFHSHNESGIRLYLDRVPVKDKHNGTVASAFHPKLAEEFNLILNSETGTLVSLWEFGVLMANRFNQNFSRRPIRLQSFSLDWRDAEPVTSHHKRPFRPGIDTEHTDTRPYVFATMAWSPTNQNLGTYFPHHQNYQAKNTDIVWMIGDRGAKILNVPATLHKAPQFSDSRLLIRWDFEAIKGQ